jgi:hypothetical protein
MVPATAWGESTPTGSSATSSAAVSVPTGTLKIDTPGIKAETSSGNRSVSISVGKPAMLPTGTYRILYVHCTKEREKDGKAEKWEAHGSWSNRSPLVVTVVADEVTTLQVGPPLVANVRIGKLSKGEDGMRSLSIALEVTGQGGEAYRFLVKNGSANGAPIFTFVDEKGKELGQAKTGVG